MKILFLSDDFPPLGASSAAKACFNLAQVMLKMGHQVFVITTVREKKEEKSFEYRGVKIFQIQSCYHRRWRAYLSLYNPQTVSKVKRLINQLKPEVVHFQHIHQYLSYHCFKLAKEAGADTFLTAHDVMLFNYGKLATKKYLENFNYRTSWWDHLKQAQKRYNPLRNVIIRHYLKHIDKIFAVSESLKIALNQNGIQNVAVIYNGVDVADWQVAPELIAAFQQKYGLRGKRIVFLGGRISGFKGIKQINQAMIKVKAAIPEAFLLITGTEGIGWLSGDELKAAYFVSEVVAVPSICFDSFPNSNLEAMACKKPVVATHFGGSSEAVQDNVTGYVVNPFDVNLLAQKIIDLLTDPLKAQRFGEAGYERVRERFSLNRQFDQTLAWYNKLTFNNN